MKSTNNQPNSFSMEDFEKGLMLAGFISPSNTTEMEEREILANHEAGLKKKNRSVYFKRVVLAAEIANQLHAERTFGRIKFQKLVYLCEHAVEMDLQHRYSKLAAGPFDNKFMHTIEADFRKRKWFNIEKVKANGVTRSVYKPLEEVEKYKPYYTSYFQNQSNSISKIIDLFRTASTEHSEIAATLFYCKVELSNKDQSFALEDLLDRFYDWAIEKHRFDREKVISVWRWMIDHNMVDELD